MIFLSVFKITCIGKFNTFTPVSRCDGIDQLLAERVPPPGPPHRGGRHLPQFLPVFHASDHHSPGGRHHWAVSGGSKQGAPGPFVSEGGPQPGAAGVV